MAEFDYSKYKAGDTIYINFDNCDIDTPHSNKCSVFKVDEDKLYALCEDVVYLVCDLNEEMFSDKPRYQVDYDKFTPVVVSQETTYYTVDDIEEEKKVLNSTGKKKEGERKCDLFNIKYNEKGNTEKVYLYSEGDYKKLSFSKYGKEKEVVNSIYNAVLKYASKCDEGLVRWADRMITNYNLVKQNLSSIVKNNQNVILEDLEGNNNELYFKASFNSSNGAKVVYNENNIEYIRLDEDYVETLYEVALESINYPYEKAKAEIEKESLGKYYQNNVVENYTNANFSFYSDWHKDVYGFRPHNFTEDMIKSYKEFDIAGIKISMPDIKKKLPVIDYKAEHQIEEIMYILENKDGDVTLPEIKANTKDTLINLIINSSDEFDILNSKEGELLWFDGDKFIDFINERMPELEKMTGIGSYDEKDKSSKVQDDIGRGA